MTKPPRRAFALLTHGPLLMAILAAILGATLQLHAAVAAADPLRRTEPAAVGMSAERLERIETVFRERSRGANFPEP